SNVAVCAEACVAVCSVMVSLSVLRLQTSILSVDLPASAKNRSLSGRHTQEQQEAPDRADGRQQDVDGEPTPVARVGVGEEGVAPRGENGQPEADVEDEADDVSHVSLPELCP